MNETLAPRSKIDSCGPNQLSVISWRNVVLSRGLYSQPMLDTVVSRALVTLDKTEMNPGSVAVPQRLPDIIRDSLHSRELKLAFDTELKRLEIRQIQSQLSPLRKEIKNSFTEDPPTPFRNVPLLLVPPENLRTTIINAWDDFKQESRWIEDIFKTDLPLDNFLESLDVVRHSPKIISGLVHDYIVNKLDDFGDFVAKCVEDVKEYPKKIRHFREDVADWMGNVGFAFSQFADKFSLKSRARRPVLTQ